MLMSFGCARPLAPGTSSKTPKIIPTDLATVRGANYRGAGATNTTHYWLNYSAAETERDYREGRVSRTVADARKWLGEANGDWRAGLDIAETAANLLESAQLVPLRELPTRQVEFLRRGQEDRAALKTLLETYISSFQPYAR